MEIRLLTFARTLACLSLAFVVSCSTPDERVDTSNRLVWQQTSNQGLFTVTIEPKENRIPIGEYHEWIIGLQDRDGKSVPTARMTLNGGMPSHGHGMPSQPDVSEYLGKGEHRVEGMRFNMAGAWVLEINISSPSGHDQVKFDIELDF